MTVPSWQAWPWLTMCNVQCYVLLCRVGGNPTWIIYGTLGKALWISSFPPTALTSHHHSMPKFSSNSVIWVNVSKWPTKYSHYLYWKKSSSMFIHLFSKYILSTYYVPDNFLGTRDIVMNETKSCHRDCNHSHWYYYRFPSEIRKFVRPLGIYVEWGK